MQYSHPAPCPECRGDLRSPACLHKTHGQASKHDSPYETARRRAKKPQHAITRQFNISGGEAAARISDT
jgi:hypothetical protein